MRTTSGVALPLSASAQDLAEAKKPADPVAAREDESCPRPCEWARAPLPRPCHGRRRRACGKRTRQNRERDVRPRDGRVRRWIAIIARRPANRASHSRPNWSRPSHVHSMSCASASRQLPAMVAATPMNQPIPDSSAAVRVALSIEGLPTASRSGPCRTARPRAETPVPRAGAPRRNAPAARRRSAHPRRAITA